jgi:FtsH-binding integral membrane protein
LNAKRTSLITGLADPISSIPRSSLTAQVLQAVLITLGVFVGLTLFTFQTKVRSLSLLLFRFLSFLLGK